MTAKEADMLAWLASCENTDVEMRQIAKDILDDLLYLDQFDSPTAGRAATRKPPRQETRPLCTAERGEPTGEPRLQP